MPSVILYVERSDIDGDMDEIPVEVEYRITYRGAPAEGPSYASGGQPAEPMEYEIIEVTPDTHLNSHEEEQLYELIFDQEQENNWGRKRR